ncbi:MAG: hypothetical protein OXH63_21855 [Gemmatimonadetes bacterium]|nr:hypothetical protein [Gemmatimonadota bacterium]
MKAALFFLLACALTLGACSDDRDPVSASEPPALGAVEVQADEPVKIPTPQHGPDGPELVVQEPPEEGGMTSPV